MMIARANWKESKDGEEPVYHLNDIWFENGGFAMCEGNDFYLQTIEAVIKTIYGELETDAEYGIPYFETIWTNARFQEQWASAVREAVTELDFVDSIDYFKYGVSTKDMKLNYTLKVKIRNGGTVTVEE